jgi:predicted small secreted protein
VVPRGTAIAIALLLGAALAVAGCGLGPGSDVGSVDLTVSREFGAVKVSESSGEANESDTVMRFLERDDEIETRYGGGYVKSIDGLGETERDGHPYDWFFYVNGLESPIGAAEVSLAGGERIWWDLHDWSASAHVPAVVGSWPAPFTTGWEGHEPVVVVECEGGGAACATVRGALEGEGVKIAEGGDPGARRPVGAAALRSGRGAGREGPGGKRGLRGLRPVRRRLAVGGA